MDDKQAHGSDRPQVQGRYGRFLWSDSVVAGQPATLLVPVVLDEEMPNVTGGNLPIAFGDFRETYMIVDRHGERLLRAPYTSKPNVIFYTYRRVGGDVANFESLKFLRVETD